MSVTPFPNKRPATDTEIEAAVQQLRAAMANASPAGQRRAARMLKADTQPAGGFMRTWIDREQEIEDELEARANTRREAGKANDLGPAKTMLVLRRAARSITKDGQRMTITQAALASSLQLRPAAASMAFKELHAIGAVLGRQQSGKSITWEIDAEYASKMAEPDRLAAIERQRKIRAEEGRDPKKQARLDNVRFLDLGPIDDERQPSLID